MSQFATYSWFSKENSLYFSSNVNKEMILIDIENKKIIKNSIFIKNDNTLKI
jgi:hypothetical protein